MLTHPYARGWLLTTLQALRTGRPDAVAHAHRLAAYTAAAAVRGRLDVPVTVGYADGRLVLPTLGELRVGAPGESGRARVVSAEKGFRVRGERFELEVECPREPCGDWLPVRGLGRDGAPDPALDDLDPYRDCFGTQVLPRLGLAEADEWSGRLGAAWGLLSATVPGHAAAAAAALTTLTPLAGAGEPVAGRHGYGALGVPVGLTGDALALGLLRGFRRARFRALRDVADLYALDGGWLHPADWREEPVPVSVLLAETHERVAVAAYDRSARTLAETRRALEALQGRPNSP